MVFIDGTNLDRTCREKFFRNDIDFARFLAALSHGTRLLQTYYVTAPYKRDINPDWYNIQIGTINVLRTMPNTTVSLQQHRMRTTICKKCKFPNTAPKEKGTDVAVAAYLVEAAVNRAADRLILVANDSDYGPVFQMAKKYGRHAVLAFVLGPAEADTAVRLGLAPLSHEAKSLIRLNQEFMATCWRARR